MEPMMAKQKEVALIARKKVVPRSAFKKGAPNPHAFQPGESGNPTGKAKNDLKLVSRSLREQIANRAPFKVAQALDLPEGSSWAQCIAARLLRVALTGDVQSIRLLAELTEGRSAPFGVSIGLEGETEFPGAARPMIHVHFTDSDGNGNLPADYDDQIFDAS
jgi:hypothetical protein